MPSLERTVLIAAPSGLVWDVVADVERWPEWTPSVRSLDLEGEALGPESRARIGLRGSLVATAWRVTEFVPPRSFTWESAIVPGVTAVATHVVVPAADATQVTLGVEYRGPLAAIVGALLGATTRRNVEDEAAGLKRVCEERASAS